MMRVRLTRACYAPATSCLTRGCDRAGPDSATKNLRNEIRRLSPSLRGAVATEQPRALSDAPGLLRSPAGAPRRPRLAMTDRLELFQCVIFGRALSGGMERGRGVSMSQMQTDAAHGRYSGAVLVGGRLSVSAAGRNNEVVPASTHRVWRRPGGTRNEAPAAAGRRGPAAIRRDAAEGGAAGGAGQRFISNCPVRLAAVTDSRRSPL
ncbi:hypothetical protein HNR60_001153 [Rhodopseudomonas rhenobacensis]|uniref:Uncharacterized protein n=1 Tax=Rhodopseudomonas rhenobacensis TaxID=87461 RepID=A0A7W7Z1Z3_9BRAD|nr:hypothetical protein [Rhodopseudomonas rhenobacensis]